MIKKTVEEATANSPVFCESWEDGYSEGYKITGVDVTPDDVLNTQWEKYKPQITILPFNPEEMKTPSDSVKHPSHYTDGGIETIDYIRAKLSKEEFAGYCKGNILKYISRAGKKNNAKEDLQKAKTYIDWLEEVI